MSGRSKSKGAFAEFSPFDDATPPRSQAADTPAEPPAPEALVAVEPTPPEPAMEQVPGGGGVAELAAAIPEPRPHGAPVLTLTVQQQDMLARCEAGIRLAEGSFILLGKALQAIRDGRWYEPTHTTFDLYCRDAHDISRRRADQMIQTWEIGLEVTRAGGACNTRQAQALAPYAAAHGMDAAVAVYLAVQHNARKPTAALLERVVAGLPDQHDPAELEERVKALIVGPPPVLPAPPEGDRAAAVFAAELARLRKVSGEVVESARAHPDEALRFAATLRSLADRVEGVAGVAEVPA